MYYFLQKKEQKSEVLTSPVEKRCKTEERTSSERDDVRRAVIRPTPFAADHLTIVSCKRIVLRFHIK